MKKQILTLIIGTALMMSIAACGTPPAQSDTPQTSEEPVPPTQTAAPPTGIPATAENAAPTDEPASTTPESPSSANVSFAADIAPIFEAKCIRCHGVETTREGLDMRTYDNLLKGSRNGSVVTPGSADESLFVQLIVEGEMPSRGTKVTPEELQLIIDWVNQGALNN